MNKVWYVYILASKKDWVLYVWVTNNLQRRICEHKEWLVDWFTKKYLVKRLVYREECPTMETAIQREKQIKWWSRDDKIRLIESINNNWNDLYDDIIE